MNLGELRKIIADIDTVYDICDVTCYESNGNLGYASIATTAYLGKTYVNQGYPIRRTFQIQFELPDKIKESQDTLTFGNQYEIETERLSFKTFDKVLVRNQDEHKWRPAIFVQTRIGESPYKYNALLLSTGHVGDFTQCIPYEGNEKLAFTAIPF
mgnify:FL=1